MMRGTMIINEKKRVDKLSKKVIEEVIYEALTEQGLIEGEKS